MDPANGSNRAAGCFILPAIVREGRALRVPIAQGVAESEQMRDAPLAVLLRPAARKILVSAQTRENLANKRCIIVNAFYCVWVVGFCAAMGPWM